MSGPIHVSRVQVLDNPASFRAPIKLEITFDSIAEQLEQELEWKVVYVGSSTDESMDQVLDSVLVGPVRKGRSRFVLEVDGPDHTKIPPNELLDVTVLLLTCSYKGNEFVRIGYYVNNEFANPAPADAPASVDLSNLDINQIVRNILSDAPVVTRFEIPWDGSSKDDLESFMQKNAVLVEQQGDILQNEIVDLNELSGGDEEDERAEETEEVDVDEEDEEEEEIEGEIDLEAEEEDEYGEQMSVSAIPEDENLSENELEADVQ